MLADAGSEREGSNPACLEADSCGLVEMRVKTKAGTGPPREKAFYPRKLGRTDLFLVVSSSGQIWFGIDRLIVDSHFIMQVWPGRTAGRAHQTKNVARINGLAYAHIDLRKVAIPRRQAAPMVNVDHIAVASLPTGDRDLA